MAKKTTRSLDELKQLPNYEDMFNQIKIMNADGDNRSRMKSYLIIVHDLKEKEANEFVLHVLGKSGRDPYTQQKLVAYVRKYYDPVNHEHNKEKMIEDMVEISGAAPSTMRQLYNYIRFAIEFARQENEGIETDRQKEKGETVNFDPNVEDK